MDGINRIIEQNIKKAIDQGAFDDLPGKGKAQQLTDLRFIPQEQRAVFLTLRNSGSLPPEKVIMNTSSIPIPHIRMI